jgi:hypothetical protein
MSLTRTFLLGDICVQSIEGNHVDNVIALIEAKADINPKNVASTRRGMPTHLYCVSVSLCVCRLRFLRCYELLQEDILIVSSHCSKPELTYMKCVLVLPVCGLRFDDSAGNDSADNANDMSSITTIQYGNRAIASARHCKNRCWRDVVSAIKQVFMFCNLRREC